MKNRPCLFTAVKSASSSKKANQLNSVRNSNFKCHLVELRTRFMSLKTQFSENKLKFKKTSTEWTLDHIINRYKENDEHSWASNKCLA